MSISVAFIWWIVIATISLLVVRAALENDGAPIIIVVVISLGVGGGIYLGSWCEALSEGMLKAVANAVPVQTNAAQQASPQQNRAEDTAAAQSANDHEGADEEPEEPSGPDEDGLF